MHKIKLKLFQNREGSMKKLLIVCGVILGSALAAEVKKLPDNIKHFSRDMAKAMPEAAKVEPAGRGIYHVLDGKSAKLGKLYLERISDDDRKMGYAGTIEIAVLFGNDDKVAGVLIGKNQETPSFLNRVRAAKFLQQWNRLKMSEIPNQEVDAVSGATYSSEAIKHGVRKLAESYLSQDEKTPPKALTKAERTAIEREIIQLERKVKMHERIYASSERLLKQLQTRKDDELQLRFLAAVEGKDAAAEFAKKHNMMYFNHPRRGPAKKSKTELLAEKYKASKSEADLKTLKDAILADYEGMLLRVPPHNEEHAKAMKASQARIEVLKKKLGENAQEKSKAGKDPHMKFRSPEAQAQQEKIEKLAEVYRNTRNPQVLAALKKEVTKQVVGGIAAMSAKITKMEQDADRLQKHLDALLEDPEAVIQKRLDALTAGK